MRKKSCLSFIILLAIILSSCSFKTEYGLKAIESPSGEKFYFHRVVKGLNYDTLTLSKSSDYCAEPDPDTTIIFHGLGPITVFYKFVGDELHIYDTTSTDVPRNFSERIKVNIHKISNPQFIAMTQNYKEKELEKSDVPINKKLFCVF